MLKSETIDLPLPKQPAFTERHIAPDAASLNNVSVTMVQGR